MACSQQMSTSVFPFLFFFLYRYSVFSLFDLCFFFPPLLCICFYIEPQPITYIYASKTRAMNSPTSKFALKTSFFFLFSASLLLLLLLYLVFAGIILFSGSCEWSD